MMIYVLAGNIGTGKTDFAKILRSNNPKMNYLDIESLTRNLNIGELDYNPSLIAISKGLMKDFVRRTISSGMIVIETMSISSRARKGLATSIKNALEEKAMENVYTLTLCNFGPGDKSSLEKAVANPFILAGGAMARERLTNLIYTNQQSYDAPKGDEGFDNISENR